MVKAGVYLLLRLFSLEGGTTGMILSLVGGMTMLVASIQVFRETDMKLILAYTTVGALGLMLLLIPFSPVAAVTLILAHACYKCAGFMVVGNIEYSTATRNIRHLGNLASKIPVSFYGSLLAFLSMIGMFPFLGFVVKEKIWTSLFELGNTPLFNTFRGVTFFTLVSFVTAACLVLLRPFLQVAGKTSQVKRVLSPVMSASTLVLGFVGLAAGIFVRFVGQGLIQPVLPESAPVVLWEGANLALFASLLSIFAGLLWLVVWSPVQSWLDKFLDRFRFDFDKVYHFILGSLVRFARFSTNVVQNGYLRYYFSVFVGTTTLLVAMPLIRSAHPLIPVPLTSLSVSEIILCLVILLSAFVVVASLSRLAAIAALGAVGYGVALIFLFYGTPDLSLTQILVDTLMVIVFVLVFYHLPRFTRFSTRLARVRDGVLALSFGGAMMVLIASVSDLPVYPSISWYFAETSVSLAYGRNVVNTILVDYRALDTLGEITVLSLAAMGVYSLLKFGRLRREEL
jgi:multicomponent Na+:H+ antiporter subunit A